ncbi:MAG TPA: chemotaxis protein CheW [Xanthobacteraceae bacterium]
MAKGARSDHRGKDALAAAAPIAAAAALPAAPAIDDMRAYVTFRVDDATWGVPLAEVAEITRMPDVVRVPRSPKSLAGLANLRGTVLPVADLRRLMRFADAPPSDDARVVVLDRAFPIGFKVDGMASLVNVPASRIEPPDQVGSGIDSAMLRGLFRDAGGAGTTRILDPDALLRRDFGPRRTQDGALARRQAGPAVGPGAYQEASAASADALVLVSFQLGRQEYALPLARVSEIVPLPDSVSAVPRAETAVLGVTTIRDELVPLLSLHALLGFPLPDRHEEGPHVIVVSYGRTSVGLVADRTRDILRIDQNFVDPVPTMLSRGQGTAELQAICRLDGGRRLVSVLSPDRLFRHDVVTGAVAEGERAREANMAGERQAASDEQQFIVFRLDREEYAVPIDAVDEVTRRPDALTRVPKSPEFIDGVMNLRGAVIPVVDQRRRFDLPAAESTDRQRVIVITFDGLRAGFLVDSASELLKIAGSAIGPAPELSDEQVRLISRVANLGDRMILIVDAPELLNRRELGLLRQMERAGSAPA